MQQEFVLEKKQVVYRIPSLSIHHLYVIYIISIIHHAVH